MLSFGRMVERQSEPPKGEPAARRGVGSTRLKSCEASQENEMDNGNTNKRGLAGIEIYGIGLPMYLVLFLLVFICPLSGM